MTIKIIFKNGLKTEIPFLWDIELHQGAYSKIVEVVTEGEHVGSDTENEYNNIERIEIIP